MQIVIDIPEQMYQNAKADILCGGDILVKAIKNGTPLPKGHGRLIAEPTEEEIIKTIGGKNDFADCIRDGVKAWDENEYSFRGHVEKLEEIDGTKSALFYFNKTDTFLIYSKKSGQWFEISRKDAENSDVTVSGNNEVEE